MFVNFLVLFLMIALAVFFGWLTVRAVKAKRLWVKVAGGLGAGLLTLVFAAIVFFGGKGMAMVYFPGADPAPNLTVAGDAAQIARGEYLTNLSCIGCHSAPNAENIPTGEHPLSGGWNIAQAEGFGFVGDMVAENLTPGGKLAGYTDGELFRVLRFSITQDGRRLGFMSLMPYYQLSDADTEAIIAYLRTLPAVTTDGATGDNLSFIGAVMFGAGMFGQLPEPAASVPAIPEGVTVEYGQYVATFGDCRGCHGADATGVPASPAGPAVPNPRPLASSITSAQFIEMMRTGIKPGGVPFPETMPWQNAAGMTDDDLAALHLYLSAPVK